ncbi:MAG: efflux RND transporter periplasmic adaptor subunit [Thermodesulfobacteriota bacterium]
MKAAAWLGLVLMGAWGVLASVEVTEVLAQGGHQGHGKVESKKAEDSDFEGLTMESIQKEGKMVELGPGSVQLSPERQQMIGIRFGSAEMRRLEKVIRTTGRVDYDEKRLVTISPKIGGWVEELFVDFTGAYVKKGDPLLTIYSPELVSTQEEYLVALQAREIFSKSPFPEVASGGDSLAASARRRLKLWDITEDQIERLEKTGQPSKTLTLFSPYEGFLLEKMAYKGMNVMPGMALFKLADLSVVWIYADIYEYELPLIRLGQTASFRVPYLKAERFTGKVIYIYPSLDPKARTAKVRLEFPNSKGALKPEMYAEVEIRIDLGQRLAVPESAIIDTGLRQVAIIDRGSGYFEPRDVKLGVKVENYYEVIQGLKPGERVVTSANFLIDSESKFKEAVGGGGGHAGHGN